MPYIDIVFLFVLLRGTVIVLETKLKAKFITKLKTTVVIQMNLKMTLITKFKQNWKKNQMKF
jgi:hypothetical protein